MAEVDDPGRYQFWQLQLLAEERRKIFWDRKAYELAYQAGFHGVKRPRAKDFNPLEGSHGVNMAEWREFSEKAKEQLPDERSEEEIQKILEEKLQWQEQEK